MAITKRVKVSFELTCVFDDKELYEDLKNLILEGGLSGRSGYVVRESLEGGLEAAALAMLKSGLPEMIKEAVKDASHSTVTLRSGPVVVRNV